MGKEFGIWVNDGRDPATFSGYLGRRDGRYVVTTWKSFAFKMASLEEANRLIAELGLPNNTSVVPANSTAYAVAL